MKKALTTLILFASIYSYGQQDPYFTHFKDVLQTYNPAAAGEHWGDICVSGLTHHQWRDYDDQTFTRGKDGDPNYNNDVIYDIAPVTYNLNVGTSFRLSKDNSKFLGAGISVIDDKIGYTKSTAFMLNLNYKMMFQGDFREIAIGAGLGATQWGWDKPNYKSKDQLDPNIPVSGGNQTKFDANFGAMFKQQRLSIFKDFYAGLSVTNLNSAQYSVQLTTQGGNTTLARKFVPHYYTIVGADWELDNGIILEPAILGKYALVGSEYRPQFDVNMTALFAKTFRGGLAYRQWGNADAISLLLGYEKDPLQIGYSYDITVSNVQKVSNGTHEIFLKYCFGFVTEPSPPIIRLTPRFL